MKGKMHDLPISYYYISVNRVFGNPGRTWKGRQKEVIAYLSDSPISAIDFFRLFFTCSKNTVISLGYRFDFFQSQSEKSSIGLSIVFSDISYRVFSNFNSLFFEAEIFALSDVFFVDTDFNFACQPQHTGSEKEFSGPDDFAILTII